MIGKVSAAYKNPTDEVLLSKLTFYTLGAAHHVGSVFDLSQQHLLLSVWGYDGNTLCAFLHVVGPVFVRLRVDI